MGALKTAYEIWKFYQPESDKDCCNEVHVRLGSDSYWQHRNDEHVCERELAWRKYVRIRDAKESWPFFERDLQLVQSN